MPYRRRLSLVAALGILAAVLILVAPRVSASSDGLTRAVNGVSLVNDRTHRAVLGLSPLTDGTTVDLTRLSTADLGLRAALAAGVRPGSVTFTMSGAKGTSYARTDSRAPYFLCGDYVRCPLLATPDAYTLTVQAYTGASATGVPLGVAFSVRFAVSATATAAQPLDVLFVGNSLLGTVHVPTGEDTPALVRRLAAYAGRTVNVTEVIHYGYTLRHTWNEGAAAQALNGSKRYDFIVLQEYSTLVSTNLSAATTTLLDLYAPTFARALKPGGRVVLFKNWALVNPSPFRTRAAAKKAIDANYETLSASLATPNLLAPIGDEFETVVSAKGTSFLIVPDGKHPNDCALYLDAVTLYGIIFGTSPRTLADLYVPVSVASYLRAVAATAIGY
jgi:hypothetical protein